MLVIGVLVLGARGTDTVFIGIGRSKCSSTCDSPGARAVTSLTERSSMVRLCARGSGRERQFRELRLSAIF